MSLDLCLKQLHVIHFKVFHRMQYIHLLLFYSVIFQSVIFSRSFSSSSFSNPANSTPATSSVIFQSCKFQSSRFSWDDLRKILHGGQRMARVLYTLHNREVIFADIPLSIVHERYRQTDDIFAIAKTRT